METFTPVGTALSSSLPKCHELPSKLLSHVLPLEDGPRILCSDSWKSYSVFYSKWIWHQCLFFKCIVSLNGSFPSLVCTPWCICRQRSYFLSASNAMLKRLLSRQFFHFLENLYIFFNLTNILQCGIIWYVLMKMRSAAFLLSIR